MSVGNPRRLKIAFNTSFRENERDKNSIDAMPNQRYFLYLGRITQFKNVKFIVENFIKFRSENQYREKIHLRIIGDVYGYEKISNADIEYRKSILSLITAEKAHQFISIEPATDNVLGELSGAIALIVASKAEGAPLVLFEAMSVATPVLGANVDGIRDFIAHDITGLLFEPGNELSFKKQLSKFDEIQDLSQTLGMNSLTEYEKKYSNKIFFDNLRELFFE
ncbi:glycosyltransferase [Planktomarina temperata]|nr:glycosyltransferase [Planktomarina temperata]